VLEDARQAFDNRQPEPEAARDRAPCSRRWNSLRSRCACERDTDAGVIDSDSRDAPGAGSRPSTRRSGYLMALEIRFCNSRRSNSRSDATGIEQGTRSI